MANGDENPSPDEPTPGAVSDSAATADSVPGVPTPPRLSPDSAATADQVSSPGDPPTSESLYEMGDLDPIGDFDTPHKVEEWLKKYWREAKKCPICTKPRTWYVEPKLFLASRTRAPVGRSEFPITCKECGFTYWVNAHWAQVAEPNPRDKRKST
jgi:hypothetical protein